jgi:hypothetical protein
MQRASKPAAKAMSGQVMVDKQKTDPAIQVLCTCMFFICSRDWFE